jgi:hypothetical protein
MQRSPWFDVGLGLSDRDVLADLATVLDPADVRWIRHPQTRGKVELLHQTQKK